MYISYNRMSKKDGYAYSKREAWRLHKQEGRMHL